MQKGLKFDIFFILPTQIFFENKRNSHNFRLTQVPLMNSIHLSFFLFDHLNKNGLYIIEDLQTSYFPRYGGSRYKLRKNRTSMNYIKSLTDSINYEHYDRPFFKRKKFDGIIKYIHFYQNIAIIKKGESVKYFYKDKDKQNNFSEKIKKIISNFYK